MPLKKLNLEELEKKMNRTMWSLLSLIFLGGGVVILWVWVPSYVIQKYQPSDGVMNPGTYGDTFGTVNALFAGLAFAGLIWSIYQTNKELRLQKQVVLLQIEEMRESKEAMRDQATSQSAMNLVLIQLTSEMRKATEMSGLIALLDENYRKINRTEEIIDNINHLRAPPEHYKSRKKQVEKLRSRSMSIEVELIARSNAQSIFCPSSTAKSN